MLSFDMPVDSQHFRPVCGLFCAIFQNFMLCRARRAARLYTRIVSTRIKVELLLVVFFSGLLLCCGDVERNPGPVDSPQTETPAMTDSVVNKIMDCLQKQGEKFESSISLLRGDLSDIKSDMSYVRKRCDDIDERCGRLEDDYENLSGSVNSIKDNVNKIAKEKEENKKEIVKLTSQVFELQSGIRNINEEIDRLESFSRRNNLRMFGVPPMTDKTEDYDDCAAAVVKVLKTSDWSEEKDWSVEDIERAHRVGPGKDNEHRTMIVKFTNWRDKMALLKNKSKREKLQKEAGIRLANDFTKRQSAIVAEARREGKAAYFKNGKLQIEPRRPDPRTYAEVVGTEAGTVPADNTARRKDSDRQQEPRAQEQKTADQRKQGHVGRRSEEGDSPHQACDDSSPVTQRRPARGARNQSPSTSRQAGLRNYLQRPATRQSKSQSPRQSQRQRQQKK